MNKLSTDKRVAILSALVEGNSLRSTVRMTGCSINTVTKLLVDVGEACDTYMDEHMRGLSCQRVQCDEIWSFCYSKEKNVPAEKRGTLGIGDVWTWAAIDADTKLIPTWMVGHRDAPHANGFMMDLAKRIQGRFQLTTDGLPVYRWAVGMSFKGEVDYAMLVKVYGQEPGEAGRYSPPICIGANTKVITGQPDPDHISTSFVERQNLTMRMRMRRFTRLTNGFSKKIENHCHAIALHFMHYNFVRRHMSLRVTPAMAAGITNRLWGLEDIVGLVG